MTDLQSMAACWRRDLLENVVPFWEKYSIDTKHGGFYTALDEDGTVLDTTKFMWLQGRAVFTWSRLHNELRSDVGSETAGRWFAHAQGGARFLSHGKLKEGTLAFSVCEDGSLPTHFQRKPYSAVFYVLGCLEYAEALRVRAAAGEPTSGDTPEAWLLEAEHYFERLRGWIENPSALGRTGAPSLDGPSSPSTSDAPSRSSLADVMCLAGLAEEMLAKLPAQRERWMAHVRDAQRRVLLHYEPTRHILMESADTVRGVTLDEPAGRLFNPGHSIEVAWFLLRLCQLAPSAELQRTALDALEGSLVLGWDSDAHGGGLLYMMDVLGRPLQDCTVTAENKLWWPICEAIIACTLAIEVSGDEGRWMPWLQKVHAYAYTHLCDADGGGEWFGYLRRDGTAFNRCKGSNCICPARTQTRLLCAAPLLKDQRVRLS